jgi:hypothetical protein
MTGPGDVPAEVLDRLRPICRRLPETYEEPAWIEIAELIADSYCEMAPKFLAAQVTLGPRSS